MEKTVETAQDNVTKAGCLRSRASFCFRPAKKSTIGDGINSFRN